MSNAHDNALEAVRNAVVNAAEMGLTKPEIADAVARGLHTNNHPRNGHVGLAGDLLNDPIDVRALHTYGAVWDDEL
jgi:hypothetical protein